MSIYTEEQAKAEGREIKVAKTGGFNETELRRIMQIVSENRERYLEAWNEFFG